MLLLLIIASDGHIADDEAHGFNSIINRMELFRAQTSDQFSAMLDRLLGLIKRENRSSLLQKSAEALPDELRVTVFCLAVDLVFADGNVEDEEKAMIEELQQVLNIEDDVAENILEVLKMKNFE